MESEDDDFYEPGPATLTDPVGAAVGESKPSSSGVKAADVAGSTMEAKLMADLEEGEEEEEEAEDTDDSDIDIITERKDGVKPEPPPKSGRHHTLRSIPTRPTPSVAQEAAAAVKAEPAAKAATPTRPGLDYPAVHTSKLDIEHVPVYQPVGKPLNELDVDQDLKEHDKAWRIPGTDVSDYFNYGFDEFTWTLYCLKQEKTRTQVQEDKAHFTSGLMLGGEGAALADSGSSTLPSNAAQPGLNLPPIPGMPDMPPEMQAMFAQMMASGIDPAQLAQMDPGAFGMAPPAAGQAAPVGQTPGASAPAFGNGPPGFGSQSQNSSQMPYSFDPALMGVDGGRNRPNNFGGRGRGGRRQW